jgi:hypothetical protein
LSRPQRQALTEALGRESAYALPARASSSIAGGAWVSFFIVARNPHPTVSQVLKAHSRAVVAHDELAVDERPDSHVSGPFGLIGLPRVFDEYRPRGEFKRNVRCVGVVRVFY